MEQIPRADDSEQLVLPLDVRRKRDVSWIVAEQEIKKRPLWFGSKVVNRVVKDEIGRTKLHTIDSNDISKVKDLDLKMALQLADAARAMGHIKDSEISSHAHYVVIKATDEGFDSKLLDATYSGHQDDLMNDLHLFAPENEDN